jgi:two-component system, chemotaxis family, response regulator Rcp1
MSLSRNGSIVFLVEDNPADIFFVRTALQSEGIDSDVLVAQDGEKAIAFVETVDSDPEAPCPQVILLDLNLPRTSGMEVLRCVKRSARFSDVPVIIVTSSVAATDRAEAASLGANGYFLKPQNLDEYMKLGSIVKAVL